MELCIRPVDLPAVVPRLVLAVYRLRPVSLADALGCTALRATGVHGPFLAAASDAALHVYHLLLRSLCRGFHNCARLMLSFLLDPALSGPAAAAAGDASAAGPAAGPANATPARTNPGPHRRSKGLLQEAYTSHSSSVSASASGPEAQREGARATCGTTDRTVPATGDGGRGVDDPASRALARAASASFAALLSQVQAETGLGLLLHAVRSASTDTVDLVLRASRALGSPLDVMEEGEAGAGSPWPGLLG